MKGCAVAEGETSTCKTSPAKQFARERGRELELGETWGGGGGGGRRGRGGFARVFYLVALAHLFRDTAYDITVPDKPQIFRHGRLGSDEFASSG